MSYAPIAAIIPQYDEQTGFYLKFYIPNTTTPIAMSVDKNGTTLLAKCQLDNDGFPTTDGTQLFIPRLARSYDAYLFPSAALADANDTTNAKRVAKDNRPLNSGDTAQNLKDYGAVGDGVTDDSDAVQEWANQGGRLFAPRGIYRLTKQINFNRFGDVFGETAGVGTGGGSWATLQQQADEGATIFAPDTVGFVGENVFLAENTDTEYKALPSIGFSNFQIYCDRNAGTQAHLLHVVNAYDSLFIKNLNLNFVGGEYNALRLEVVAGSEFPRVAQTGIVENVVAIGDDLSASSTAPTVFIERQQEMQFIGLKSFGGAQSLEPKPTRTPIAIQDCRGITMVGCSSSICDDNTYGLDIYCAERLVDGVAVIGHTFENCAATSVGLGTGGAFRVDSVTRNTADFTVSKVYIKQARYQFPQGVAGKIDGATQCEIDAGTSEVFIEGDARNCTIFNLAQENIFDNSGNSTNTTITPINSATNSRTQSTGYAVQKDSPSIDFLSSDLSEGYRFVASIAAAVDLGMTLRKLDSTIIHTYLPNGAHQINTSGRGTQYRVPNDDKFYELKVLDDGTIRLNDPANNGDFNINNDIPITSTNVTFTFSSLVVGANIRRDLATPNTVRIPEDATLYPVNGQCTVTQTSPSTVTIDGEAGVTINGVLNGSTTMIGFSAGLPVTAKIVKRGANNWEVTGSISPVT